MNSVRKWSWKLQLWKTMEVFQLASYRKFPENVFSSFWTRTLNGLVGTPREGLPPVQHRGPWKGRPQAIQGTQGAHISKWRSQEEAEELWCRQGSCSHLLAAHTAWCGARRQKNIRAACRLKQWGVSIGHDVSVRSVFTKENCHAVRFLASLHMPKQSSCRLYEV